jgi:gamma-butyrobetaine dioxygenase
MNIQWDALSLTIEWPDGKSVRFPAVWLRDQDLCDRDPGNSQRLVDILDLPERPEIQSAKRSGEDIEIQWAGEPRATVLPIGWLRSLLDPPRSGIALWTSQEASRLRWADYTGIERHDESRFEWLSALTSDGIAFLTGVPTGEGEVGNVASLLGYITETNYGRLFDVREVANPNNLANTSRGLVVHTDNPYREPVPGFQLLHCLTAALEGGESVFVDGFAAAMQLRQDDPCAFEVLTITPVEFTFRDAETDLRARRTLIHLDDSGLPQAIHYNNRSISTARIPPGTAEPFYRAYRGFARMLRSAEFEYRVTLRPGDLVAFDNQRVLHGRTAFSGSRLLQGCYVARDGVLSSTAVLRRGEIR